uniref:Uncharacterized protein n=1 Tax=Candidatus Kentrum eta TaxID=2126337 RepID=A0A450VWZ1_9GAMM|nr:MAG: hypothetical protein BECKH772A_GA0070896_109822 [Candidatus Kentron sp. H]
MRSGKLRVCAHLCLSFLSERKVMMLRGFNFEVQRSMKFWF